MTFKAALSDRRLAVAPMLDWTDRHQRMFMRCLTERTWLYSEMAATGAMLHGDKQRFLGHSPQERPLALQLGGSNPDDLARCAALGEEWGYDEININIGCPSARVSSGRFGACLMAEPLLAAACVRAMMRATSKPVTVKHRIGIDALDSEEFLNRFVATLADAGCRIFIVHARKAWLSGLSPKENRSVPPLRHDAAHRLKTVFPELTIILNGGLKSLADASAQWKSVDGAMIGRAAYENPYVMAGADRLLGCSGEQKDCPPPPSRAAVIARYRLYVEEKLAEGVPLFRLTRHILGLYRGQPHGKTWRQILSAKARLPGSGTEVLDEALGAVEQTSFEARQQETS